MTNLWVINITSYTFYYNATPNFREGDISLVQADAITNTTDETLTEKNIISDRIFSRAGPGLKEELVNQVRG